MIAAPGSLWSQLSNLSIICAGLFSDLLLVRLFITLAYAWRLVQAGTGAAVWGAYGGEPGAAVSVDTIVWSAVGIYIQGASLVQLLLDERPVELSEDEEELWRLFYRLSGITRLMFLKRVLRHGQFRSYAPGESVVDEDSEDRVHIVVQGHLHAKVRFGDGSRRALDFFSGDMLGLRHLSLMGVPIGFQDARLQCFAKSAAFTFSVDADTLESLGKGPSTVRQAWLSVIVSSMARALERRTRAGALPGSSDSIEALCQLSPEELQAWRHPAFRELSAEEQPAAHVPGSGRFFRALPRSLVSLMAHTLALPFPCGRQPLAVRHAPGLPQRLEPGELQETMSLLLRADRARGMSGDDGWSSHGGRSLRRKDTRASSAAGAGAGAGPGGEAGATPPDSVAVTVEPTGPAQGAR